MLTTASHEARKYGVRSGMPGKTHLVHSVWNGRQSCEGYIALKLCPDFIFVDLNMSRYSEVSKQIMALYREYDPNMLAASVDEAYLKQVFSPAPALAGEGELFLTV